MATPSVSVSIASVDESTKTITYNVSYSAESHFTANELNYYGYVNGTGDAYVGYSYPASGNVSRGAVSYQTEYDNYESSKTFSVTYHYYKEYITQTWDGTYSRYSSQSYGSASDAESAISGLTGGSSLYKVSGNTASGYFIKKKNCTYAIQRSTSASSGTASATAYFKPKPSTPSTPSPSFSISYTATTATASITNLTSGQNVNFHVLQIYSPAGGFVVDSVSDTATGSSMSLTVSGLTANTGYTARVFVDDAPIGDESFTTLSASSNPICETSFDNNQITVVISNISVGETAWLYIRESDDITGSLPSYTKESYTRISSTDSSSVTWTKTVEYDISYTYSVVIQPNNIYLVDGETFTLTLGEEFNWTTDIQQWKKMEIWQHPASGYMLPAPVTAEEWNRLVKIVNTKCGTDIDDVSIGEPMRAGPGGNVRQVADALGVKVDKGDRITAEFFLKLQDAVNNYKING